MKTTIYYFSATGNSLHFARQLANELNTKNLVAISEVIAQESIPCNSDRIGIICPVFAWGTPRIVNDFLNKFKVEGNPYIFAIVSCVGIPAKTLPGIQNILRQKKSDLNAGFVIKAPSSSLAKKNTLDNIIIKLDRKKRHLKTGEERLQEIVTTVENLSPHKPETSSWPANIFGTFFHKYGLDFFKTASQDFVVNDRCIGCGICVRVCPRANIILDNKTPRFLNNCEFCHACIQWCPEFAITHPNFNPDLKQYRNPEVWVNELVVNA